MTQHGDLVNDILIELSQIGLVWSNQTGQGWTGKYAGRQANGAVVIANARPVKFGLPGSTDVLACVKGRMVVVEVKTGTGRLQQNQKDFRAAADRAGALHIEARSVDDVRNALRMEGLL
jgi:hypothetical protein